MDMIRPSNKAATQIIHNRVRVATYNPIAAANSAKALCVTISNRRRSNRSAMTPP